MRHFTLLTAIMLVLLSAIAGTTRDKKETPKLPGAKGPVYEKVGKLKNGVEVLSADVSHDVKDLKFHPAEPPKTRVLPAGTSSKFRVGVCFNKAPADNCFIEIYNAAGAVPIAYSQSTTISQPSGNCMMIFTGQGREKLADGAYQAKLRSGKEVFLVVNWYIGDPSK